jgi:hypothetical protein
VKGLKFLIEKLPEEKKKCGVKYGMQTRMWVQAVFLTSFCSIGNNDFA